MHTLCNGSFCRVSRVEGGADCLALLKFKVDEKPQITEYQGEY